MSNVTKTALIDFIRSTNKPTNEEITQMQWFRNFVVPMSAPEVKELFKQAAAQVRQDAGLKPEDKTKASEEVRLSEARQIYGAEKFAGIDCTGMGWHKAVEASRKALKEKNVDWQGIAKKTADERATLKASKLKADIFAEVSHDYPQLSDADKMAKVYEVLEEREEQARIQEAQDIVDKLIEQRGIDFAELVSQCMVNSLHAYRAAQAEQQHQQQAAA